MEHIEKFRANKVREETPPERASERGENCGDTPNTGEGDKQQPGEGQDRREYGEAEGLGQAMGGSQGQGDGQALDDGSGDQPSEGPSTSSGSSNQNTGSSSVSTPCSDDSSTSGCSQSSGDLGRYPSTITLTPDSNTSVGVENGPTRPCTPVGTPGAAPELIPLFDGRTVFRQFHEDRSESSYDFRSPTEESQKEEDSRPSTSAHSAAQARIIAARAKREKLKTAKRGRYWPRPVAGRGQRGGREPSKVQSIKQMQELFANPKRCVQWGSRGISKNKKYIGKNKKYAAFFRSYEDDDFETYESLEESSEIEEKKERTRCILYHEMEGYTTIVDEKKHKNAIDKQIEALNKALEPGLIRFLESRKTHVQLSKDAKELHSLFYRDKKPKATERESRCILQALMHTKPTPTPFLWILPKVPSVDSFDPLAQNESEEVVSQDQADHVLKLRKLFINQGRVKKHRFVTSWVTPEDPLEAAVLPKLEFRSGDQDQDEKLALDPKEMTEESEYFEEEESYVDGVLFMGYSENEFDPECRLPVSLSLGRGNFVPDIYSSTGLRWQRRVERDWRGNEVIHKLDPDMCKPVEIPKAGDFRAHFQLDEFSLWALLCVGQMEPPGLKVVNHGRVRHYMEHFYRSRLITDGPHFQWFVNEGFLVIHYLLHEQSYDELDTLSNKTLDKLVLKFIEKTNQPGGKRVILTDVKAYYMVVTYFKVLYNRAIDTILPMEDRFLMRSRFTVFLTETYFKERGHRPIWNELDCTELLTWSLKHEGRVHAINDHVMGYAAERADTFKDGMMTMQIPNLHEVQEFYERGILPRPDHLTFNPCPGSIRRYTSERMDNKKIFLCPIRGCKMELVSTTLMAHFLSDHCRRIEEIWARDRLAFFIHSPLYPPEHLYCLCIMAMMPKGKSEIPLPERIINAELPPPYLYFAGHVPHLLMYSPVSISKKVENRKKKEDEDETTDSELLLHIFWVACNENGVHPDMLCELYLYCSDRNVKGNHRVKLVHLSRFKGLEDLVNSHPECYLAIDHPTMVSLTKNFKELLIVEVNYIRKCDIDEDGKLRCDWYQ
ncbi:uncharacterized protein [Drosophila bipectinata]